MSADDVRKNHPWDVWREFNETNDAWVWFVIDKHQVTKILVGGHEHIPLGNSLVENGFVAGVRTFFGNPENLMPQRTKRRDDKP